MSGPDLAAVRTRVVAISAPTWGRRHWAVVAVAAALASILSLAWQVWPDPAVAHAPPAQPVVAGTTLQADYCHQPASGPFIPKSITIKGITADSTVLALPRDANGIPSPAPLTDTGKREFAWDRSPSPMPGASAGNVMLNAHTWPWFAPTALGNDMLLRLRHGDTIIVRGTSTHQCYQVTRQVQIGVEQSYPAYYDTQGPPQLAIMVCSGTRLGPGDWDHRMIWFASPLGT